MSRKFKFAFNEQILIKSVLTLAHQLAILCKSLHYSLPDWKIELFTCISLSNHAELVWRCLLHKNDLRISWYGGRKNPVWNSPSHARAKPRFSSPVMVKPPTPLMCVRSSLASKGCLNHSMTRSRMAKQSIKPCSRQRPLPGVSSMLCQNESCSSPPMTRLMPYRGNMPMVSMVLTMSSTSLSCRVILCAAFRLINASSHQRYLTACTLLPFLPTHSATK